MKKVLICLLLLPGVLFARLGGAGATFLSIGGGGRPVALGGAYSAFAQGIDAIYWNPAGIAALTGGVKVSFTHARLFAGTSGENIAVAIPTEHGVIGISCIAFLSGRIEVTTLEEQDGTGDFYTANDFAIGITYSRMLTDKFAGGITVKVVNQNIAKSSATGVAFDVGATYITGLGDLKFGFVVRDFGPGLTYSGEELIRDFDPDIPGRMTPSPYSLPLCFQIGFSYTVLSTPVSRLTIMGDLVHAIDQAETYALGIEYSLEETYFLRLGHTGKNARNLTGGIGIKLPIAGYESMIDYTYENHDYLPGIHRLSLGIGR